MHIYIYIYIERERERGREREREREREIDLTVWGCASPGGVLEEDGEGCQNGCLVVGHLSNLGYALEFRFDFC